MRVVLVFWVPVCLVGSGSRVLIFYGLFWSCGVAVAPC